MREGFDKTRQEFAVKAGYKDVESMVRDLYPKMSFRQLEDWSKDIDKYGYSRGTWGNWVKEFNIEVNPRGGDNTSWKKKNCMKSELFRRRNEFAEMTSAQISEITGMSVRYVNRACKNLGIKYKRMRKVKDSDI